MDLIEFLQKNNQKEILEELIYLSGVEKERFIQEVKNNCLKKLHFACPPKKNLTPLTECDRWEDEDPSLGEKALRGGDVATLILAGGEGSRFKSDVPKGCFILPNGKSLFQMFCEKTLLAEKKYGKKFKVIIMLSSKNEQETRTFFKKNNFLPKEQILFFVQDNLPYLDESEKWFLEAPGRPALGAAGNASLFNSPFLTQLKDERVKFITICPVDNLLADPFDARFLAFHIRKKHDVSLKCIPQKPKMGLLAADPLQVIEYIYLTEKKAKKFAFANTGLFCMSLPFLENAKKDLNLLPVHKSLKQTTRFSRHTNPSYQIVNAWKCERFIFDALFFTSKSGALLTPEDVCFAPLKGQDNILTLSHLF